MPNPGIPQPVKRPLRPLLLPQREVGGAINTAFRRRSLGPEPLDEAGSFSTYFSNQKSGENVGLSARSLRRECFSGPTLYLLKAGPFFGIQFSKKFFKSIKNYFAI